MKTVTVVATNAIGEVRVRHRHWRWQDHMAVEGAEGVDMPGRWPD